MVRQVIHALIKSGLWERLGELRVLRAHSAASPLLNWRRV